MSWNKARYEESLGRLADTLKVSPSILLAVADVEGAQVGINEDGTPLMRWEGHYFDRLLKDRPKLQALARRKGLANPKAGAVKNNKEQAKRYDVLLLPAERIDERAALESCSWGVFQIMGDHYERLGYPSVQALYDAAKTEEGQVAMLGSYLQAFHLVDELQRGDYLGFARGFNGPAQQGYDKRLKAAHVKRGGGLLPEHHEAANSTDVVSMGDTGAVVAELQDYLNRAGFRVKADRDFGPRTKKAVRLYQLDNGLEATGRVDAKTWEALKRTPALAPVDPVTPAEVAKTSRIAGAAKTLRDRAATALGIGTAATGAEKLGLIDTATQAVEKVQAVQPLLEGLKSIGGFLTDNWVIFACVAAAGVAYFAHLILYARVEDANSGKTL